jgi:hypothetical protein
MARCRVLRFVSKHRGPAGTLPDPAMRQNRDQVYFDELKTAVQWGRRYRPVSETHEHAALIYCAKAYGDRFYYIGKTYKGMAQHRWISPNVVLPFLYLFLCEAWKERLLNQATVAAFVHTHPKPDPGFTYRFHSRIDRWLLRMPKLNAVYVVPFENDEINREPHMRKGL